MATVKMYYRMTLLRVLLFLAKYTQWGQNLLCHLYEKEMRRTTRERLRVFKEAKELTKCSTQDS